MSTFVCLGMDVFRLFLPKLYNSKIKFKICQPTPTQSNITFSASTQDSHPQAMNGLELNTSYSCRWGPPQQS